MLVKLPKEAIDAIFEEERSKAHPHQANIVMMLYEAVITKNFIKVEGWPIVSRRTNSYIFDKFTEFDEKYHPDIMPRGLWLSHGFSTSEGENLPDWTVDTSTCTVTYKDGSTQ